MQTFPLFFCARADQSRTNPGGSGNTADVRPGRFTEQLAAPIAGQGFRRVLASLALPSLIGVVGACGRTERSPDSTGHRDASGGSASLGTGGRGGSASSASQGFGGTGGVDSRNPNQPRFDCAAVQSQQFDPATMQPYAVPADVQRQVDDTLALMDPAAKYTQMMGVDATPGNYQDIQRGPDVQVPGVGVVRGYRYRNGGRGVNLEQGQDNRSDTFENFATVFPAPSLRAASWDLDLERRIGAAIGDETAASRNNILTAPCMNVVRHPYWGRTQETYGEDMYLIGRMATAFTVGVQRHVAACAKAFMANNIEQQRANQNALLDEQALREIYARHFEMVVQDGAVSCLMVAYNSVNGEKSTQSQHLIRNVLKAPIEQGGMGFEGFVLTDWWAMPGEQNPPDPATAQAVTNEAVIAGTDVEMPWALHYNATTLANVDQALVEEAARRVLTQKYRFGTALDSDGWSLEPPASVLTESGSLAPSAAHEALAEEAALKSAVLLVNGFDARTPVLPLAGTTAIAVVGPQQEFRLVGGSMPASCRVNEPSSDSRFCIFDFATDPALGDRGSSSVNADPVRAIGPFQGIQEAAGADRTVTSGNSADAALNADAVVVVVGYTPGDEGEEYTTTGSGDRSSLDLPPGHAELIMSVLDLGKPTVIVIESGSIVSLPWLSHSNRNQATIWAGYPGLRGGLALGKLIFGLANFAGKMPMAWPPESQLPPFKETDTSTQMGYFFGYREFDRQKYVEEGPVDLVFPFGHGLSYSDFEYSNLVLPCQTATAEAVFNVTVDITNTSAVDGDEVVMLFVKPPPKPAGIAGERPWKELKSFTRVSVPSGQTVTAELPLRIRDLRRWEGDANGHWVIDSGVYTVLVGRDAEDAETTSNLGTFRVSGD